MPEPNHQFTKSQFKTFLKLVNDFVFILNDQYKFIGCFQPEGELLFPYEFFAGKTLQEINFPEPALSKIMNVMHEVWETGVSNSVEYSLLVNEMEKWYYATISKIENLHNEKAGFIAVIRNISEMKQYQVLLENQNKKLKDIAFLHSNVVKQKLKTVERLLKFPLSDNINPDSKEYIEIVKNSALELQDILKKLSDNATAVLNN